METLLRSRYLKPGQMFPFADFHQFARNVRVRWPVRRLNLTRIIQIGLAIVSLALMAVLVIGVVQASKTQTVRLAAGSASGDSYILCAALKKVVERHNPKLHVDVVETGGTVENLQMLESGNADLSTAQADVMPGPSARSVAVLFDDTLPLLVPDDSPVKNFSDLSGKRIALARTGGQFDSFLRVADHFNLRADHFSFAGTTDDDADRLFSQGHPDALFRVRALGNPTIQRLAALSKVRFVPIAQGPAMRIHQPAFEPSFIPAGAYRGNGLLISVMVMVGSWIWQLRSWMFRQQKNAGDEYSNRVVKLLTAAQGAQAVAELDAIKTDLLEILTAAVRDLDADKLSEESFQSFRSVLQIVLEVIRERREMLVQRKQTEAAYAAG